MRIALLIVALGLLAGGAHAQQYAFRHYGAEAGLPIAYAVAFDGAGSLLVGTNDGVVRFDGRGFEPVPLPVEGVVWRLVSAPDGAVWGLTNDGALFRLAPDGTAERIPTPAPLAEPLRQQAWPVKLRTDGHSRLWLSGGEDNALYRWEGPGRREWTRRRLAGVERIADFFVVGDGDDGALVVATRERRVGEVPLRGGRLGGARWVGLDATMRFVRPHPQALAWVGADEGVFLLGRDGMARRVTADGEGVWPHNEPAVDAAGRLLAFAGGDAGVRTTRFAPDGSVELAAGGDEGLAGVLANQYAFDPEGALWIAHLEGLATLAEERAVAFPLGTGQGGSYVTGMAGEPADGVLWATTFGGAYRLEGARLVSPPVRGVVGFAYAPVVGVDGEAAWAETPGGDVWYGRSSRGDPPGSRPILVHDGPGGRYETDEAGLWRTRAGRRVRLGPDFLPGVSGSEDAAGRLWLGGELRRLDVVWGDTLGSACPACLPPTLAATLGTLNRRLPAIYAVVADPYGRVWAAGSAGGLAVVYRRPDGAWTHRLFGTEDGLLARKVEHLDVSPDGQRLWLATWRGIQGLRLRPDPPRVEPFAELRVRDGLEGERGLAVLEDADGYLWAALVVGKIHRLDWRALTARVPSPSVHVERVEVNGQPVPERERVRLREGDGLAVGLWPQTYRQPLRVRLEYRLSGRDTAWVDLGSARRLTFAALPAGRYALDVRAVREGQAPGSAVRLGLAVAPPFWRSAWFAALVVLGLGLVVFALHRVREGRRRAAEALRLRIATDLHDEMGSGLTKVSLYSELIRRTAEGTAGGDGSPEDDDARVAAWAARVGEQAGALSGAMRDAVWAIRPDGEDWESLELRMKDAAVALLAPRGIEVDMTGEVEGAPPTLPPEVRQNVLLFFKEAVHNAVRHADPSRVEVRWRLSRQALALHVRDDGRGFDPETARRGTGLLSLRRRADELGGTFSLTSASGEGTCVALDVPLGQAWPWRRRKARPAERPI